MRSEADDPPRGPVRALSAGTISGCVFGVGVALLGLPSKEFTLTILALSVLVGAVSFGISSELWWMVIDGFVRKRNRDRDR